MLFNEKMLQGEISTAIRDSGFFDAGWYAAQYPDVGLSGIDPLEHFLRIGGLIGRSPSVHFDTGFYLQQDQKVARSGVNPLLHYLLHGRKAGMRPHPKAGRCALVIHAFHLDLLDDLRSYVANFPADADQYVTFPADLDEARRRHIAKYLPKARQVPVPNAGQDVGALLALAREVDLTKYDFLCKIHTKKGAKQPARWRHALLRGTLGSKVQVENTLSAFRSDPALLLAVPEQLYLHGPTYLWKNREGLRSLCAPLLAGFDFETRDWGFVAGTCFWVRSSIVTAICERMADVELKPAAYTDDATPAHAVERMFGMLATLRGGKVLLNDVEHPDRSRIVGPGYPDSLPRDFRMISDRLAALALPEAVDKPLPMKGALEVRPNLPLISGWLAVIGDPEPRDVIVRAGKTEVEVRAATSRADLASHGINQGQHGFRIALPGALQDGKPHKLELVDKLTGKVVATKECSWQKPVRDYVDFQGFLKSSMTRPEIGAPFMEEDKRAFATMELIANRLARRALQAESRPLVSVIMPVHDRARVVGQAIRSVLEQDYRDFELLVIDDGSTDDSLAVIRSFDDPRIRVIGLPENQGVTVARNTGLRAAQGEIIAYLDSDNTWDRRYLAATVGAFGELPDADAVYSGTLLYRGSTPQPFGMRYGHLNRALVENMNYIDNNIFAHRRSLLDRLDGGFSEDLRRYVDYDLVLRALDVGKVCSVPFLLCHYYYDKTENALTDNPAHLGDMEIVRARMTARREAFLREADTADLTHPVTVVIPNWQSLDDIRDCLAALRQRDWKGMLDIIVVDNASDAPVVDYLAAEAAAGHIRFIPNSRNLGFTYAVNQGIAQSRPGSDIVLLNNDAIAQGGAIQKLQQLCHALPDAGMTVPRQILPPGTPTLQTHVPYASPRYACDVNISAHHRNVAQVPIYHDGGPLELSYAAFFAVYIRRAVIEAIGPLDAEYGRHYRSDRVYCDMMRNLTGMKLYYAPDSHFIHKLQKATNQLRDTGQKDETFELMFRRNQWDRETAADLGYRFAEWDVF